MLDILNWEWVADGIDLLEIAAIVGIPAALVGYVVWIRKGFRKATGKKDRPQEVVVVRQIKQETVKIDETVWSNIPITPDRPIKGREADLAAIRADLGTHGTAAIVKGTGGMGKTTLARYLIQQHHGDYRGVAWIGSETEAGIDASFRTVALHLNLPIPDGTPLRPMVQHILNALVQSGDPWLLVYDNVPTPEALDGLAAEGAQLHTLITSRWGNWPAKFAVHDLEVLSSDAAIALLLAESKREDDTGAAELAEALGYLPLALVAAGGWLKDQAMPFADYAQNLRHAIEQAPSGDYPDPVIGAVKISYDALLAENAAPGTTEAQITKRAGARVLLDHFAWLATDLIEPWLVENVAESQRSDAMNSTVDQRLKDIANSPMRLADAMAELQHRSLLSASDGHYSLHRMTAAAIRALQGDKAPDTHISATAMIAARYPQRSDRQETWAQAAG